MESFLFFFTEANDIDKQGHGASLITTRNKINYTCSYLLSVNFCDVVDSFYPTSRSEHQEKEIGPPRTIE